MTNHPPTSPAPGQYPARQMRRLPPSTRLALVTGSAGFVGRHLVAGLVANGWHVDTVDLVDPVASGDCRAVFEKSRESYDLIVHAAAVIGGRMGIETRPAMLAAVDLELDAALWRYALRTRPGRVVYLSSSAVYPVGLQTVDAGELRLAEALVDGTIVAGSEWAPDQSYGMVKLVGERMADEVRAAGVPVTVVRPFSGYGTDQAHEYPFGAFIDRALDRCDPFEVWGTGKQVRDFVHIDDIVAAILTLVELDVAGPVNIGTGRPVSMLELAALVVDAAGYWPTITPLEHRPVGVAHRVADTIRLEQHYRPAVALEDGIRHALSHRRPVEEVAR